MNNTLQPLVEFYKTHLWGQGMHYNMDAFCLVEARVELGFFSPSPLARELRRRCGGNIIDFNDATDRTFDQVMEMLSAEDLKQLEEYK